MNDRYRPAGSRQDNAGDNMASLRLARRLGFEEVSRLTYVLT